MTATTATVAPSQPCPAASASYGSAVVHSSRRTQGEPPPPPPPSAHTPGRRTERQSGGAAAAATTTATAASLSAPLAQRSASSVSRNFSRAGLGPAAAPLPAPPPPPPLPPLAARDLGDMGCCGSGQAASAVRSAAASSADSATCTEHESRAEARCAAESASARVCPAACDSATASRASRAASAGGSGARAQRSAATDPSAAARPRRRQTESCAGRRKRGSGGDVVVPSPETVTSQATPVSLLSLSPPPPAAVSELATMSDLRRRSARAAAAVEDDDDGGAEEKEPTTPPPSPSATDAEPNPKSLDTAADDAALRAVFEGEAVAGNFSDPQSLLCSTQPADAMQPRVLLPAPSSRPSVKHGTKGPRGAVSVTPASLQIVSTPARERVKSEAGQAASAVESGEGRHCSATHPPSYPPPSTLPPPALPAPRGKRLVPSPPAPRSPRKTQSSGSRSESRDPPPSTRHDDDLKVATYLAHGETLTCVSPGQGWTSIASYSCPDPDPDLEPEPEPEPERATTASVSPATTMSSVPGMKATLRNSPISSNDTACSKRQREATPAPLPCSPPSRKRASSVEALLLLASLAARPLSSSPSTTATATAVATSLPPASVPLHASAVKRRSRSRRVCQSGHEHAAVPWLPPPPPECKTGPANEEQWMASAPSTVTRASHWVVAVEKFTDMLPPTSIELGGTSLHHLARTLPPIFLLHLNPFNYCPADEEAQYIPALV